MSWRTSFRTMSMSVVLALCSLDHDENFVAALDHFVFPQLQLAIADALAGLEIVLIAVPGAGEMHVLAEGLPLVGLVRVEDVHDVIDQDALAGRPAGMHAVIRVGVIVAVLEEHADLMLAGDDDPTVSVLKFGRLGDKTLGHACSTPLGASGLGSLGVPLNRSIASKIARRQP